MMKMNRINIKKIAQKNWIKILWITICLMTVVLAVSNGIGNPGGGPLTPK